MKGQVSWIIGLLVMIIVSAIFAFGVTVKHSEERQIVSSSAELYSALHVSEKIKRATDADISFTSSSILPQLASEGGGFRQWTNESPKMEQLVDILAQRLNEKSVIILDGLEGKDIEWGEPDISLQMTDDGFNYSGSYPFKVRDILSNPQVTVETANGFEGSTMTSYFSLAVDGMSLASDCQNIETGEKSTDSTTRQVSLTDEENKLYAVNLTSLIDRLQLSFTLNCTVR